MSENPRRDRQARNFTTNVPKIVFRTDIFPKIVVGCPFTVFLKKYRRTFYNLNSDNSNSALTQNVLCFSSEIELPRFYCNKRREIRTLWISISNYCFLLFMLSQGVLRISGDQDYRINFLGRNIWQVFFSVA